MRQFCLMSQFSSRWVKIIVFAVAQRSTFASAQVVLGQGQPNVSDAGAMVVVATNDFSVRALSVRALTEKDVCLEEEPCSLLDPTKPLFIEPWGHWKKSLIENWIDSGKVLLYKADVQADINFVITKPIPKDPCEDLIAGRCYPRAQECFVTVKSHNQLDMTNDDNQKALDEVESDLKLWGAKWVWHTQEEAHTRLDGTISSKDDSEIVGGFIKAKFKFDHRKDSVADVLIDVKGRCLRLTGYGEPCDTRTFGWSSSNHVAGAGPRKRNFDKVGLKYMRFLGCGNPPEQTEKSWKNAGWRREK